MAAQNGVYTGQFGEWLTVYMRNLPRFLKYYVYFHHGDRQKWPNVAKIEGYYGEKVSNQNFLTAIDILVASAENKAILLIEIEESESSPKKIVGDVFTFLMCNHIAVSRQGKQHVFQINPETKFIFAGWARKKGSKLDKLHKVISPRILNFTTPDDSIRPNNIEYIFTDELSSTLAELQKFIKTSFK